MSGWGPSSTSHGHCQSRCVPSISGSASLLETAAHAEGKAIPPRQCFHQFLVKALRYSDPSETIAQCPSQAGLRQLQGRVIQRHPEELPGGRCFGEPSVARTLPEAAGPEHPVPSQEQLCSWPDHPVTCLVWGPQRESPRAQCWLGSDQTFLTSGPRPAALGPSAWGAERCLATPGPLVSETGRGCPPRCD